MRARLLGLALIAALALLPATCADNTNGRLQGWIEADLIFVGPDESGRVETLSVREGDQATAGAPLFTLDSELHQAELASARAALTNARQAFERAQELLKAKAGTQKAFEDAQAVLREAEARQESARTRLARRKVAAPVTGRVEQIYFRPGEVVTTGRPIVALLPPGNIKVRFFVPEPGLAKVALGDVVAVECDGCPQGLTARISFISRTAEYTPPVIYSLEERAKLVFLVEARPDQPHAFRVGQPVSVRLIEQEKAL